MTNTAKTGYKWIIPLPMKADGNIFHHTQHKIVSENRDTYFNEVR